MIRRLFWLIAGVLLGVTGYRRATRLARAFALGATGSRRAGIAAAAAHATAAAGFVRDVRDGMAEYWDLHRSESDRTLGSQRDRTWSGDSQHGSREH